MSNRFVAFDEIIADHTRYAKKIPKEHYLLMGKYPIIDQGQEYIAGYSNDRHGIFNEVPAIIFGDHTRILKYIDFPFFLGADGVKLLKNRNKNVECKYLYYCLLNSRIPNTGYNRHFKWLKEIQIMICPIEKQKKIIDILDKAKSLIDLRKKQIEKMDLLIKSKFIEMFGDPVTNPKGWERTEIVRICEKIAGGGTPSKSQPDYYTGKIPWVTPKDMKKTLINDSIDHITEEAINNSSTKIIPKGSLLMVIRSGILKKTLPIAITIVPVSINQDMKAFIVNAKVNVWFLYYTLKILEPVLLSKVRGVTADNIEFDVIKNLRIPLPPLPLQSQFASFVEVIENQKNLLEQGLDKMEINYKSLMEEYFG